MAYKCLVGFFLHILICQAAWVSHYPCGPYRPNFPSHDTPFWITRVLGAFNTLGDVTELSLSFLAVYNISTFQCERLDLSGLEESVMFHVLGRPVGQLAHLKSECPLPITETLTP